MEYTNEILEEIDGNHKKYNLLYSDFYRYMSYDPKSKLISSKKLRLRSGRLKSCMDIWDWNLYRENKLMDLNTVNRCMNNRFCPNCKKMDLARCIHNFRPHFEKLLNEGYTPYLLTLTVPNCQDIELRDYISRLNESFYKLYSKFSYSIDKSQSTTSGMKFRMLDLDAAFKVLEVTYNVFTDTYHPHFHCIVFSKNDISENDIKKYIQGKYSRKRNKYNLHSNLDIHFAKIWTMIWNNVRLSKKNYYNMTSDPNGDLLMVDFRPMDEKGIYEVMKYTFKDSDIRKYEVFRTLVLALENKRIRQGYGLLFNLKTEFESDGEIQELILEKEESPQQLIVKEIRQLYTTYSDFKKISRFNPSLKEEFKNID